MKAVLVLLLALSLPHSLALAQDAEQAAREAHQDHVDVRTPKIITLCLIAPAATLLLTAAINSLFEWSPVTPFDLLPSHSGGHEADRDRHVNPANYWLAGVGGALALGAIATGVWWRLRQVEQQRLKPGLRAAVSETRLRGPRLSMRLGAASAGLVMSGRF